MKKLFKENTIAVSVIIILTVYLLGIGFVGYHYPFWFGVMEGVLIATSYVAYCFDHYFMSSWGLVVISIFCCYFSVVIDSDNYGGGLGGKIHSATKNKYGWILDVFFVVSILCLIVWFIVKIFRPWI